LIVGRKRGIATDALGLLLAVIVCAASTSENQAGMHLLDHAKRAVPDNHQDVGGPRFQEPVHRTRCRP
jgi:hypothetical protein